MGCQVFIQLFVQTLGTADLHVPRSNRHLDRRSVQTTHRVQCLAGSISACLMTRTLHPSAPVHPVTSTINGPVRAAMEFLMRSPTFHMHPIMHPIMHPTSNVRNPAERPTSHMHPTSNVRYPAERPTAAVADAPATNPALSSGAKAISVTVTHRVTPPPATEPAPATAPS